VEYVLSLLVLVAAIALHVLCVVFAPRLRLIKPNFLHKPALASYGVISLVDTAAIIWAGVLLGLARGTDAILYLSVMSAMCLLGLLDDLFGTREVGGFKGHFKKLVFERKLTTGAIKAIGGGIVGIVAGWIISNGDPGRWVTAALVIPLAANVLNLVDLRPGRAVAVFFLGLAVTCLLAHGRLASPWIVGTVALVTLAWGIADSRARAMMGDAGSNSLGAALGLTIALSVSLPAQIGAALVLVAVNWYSEKRSISALIERNCVLRAIDSRLGVR